MDLRAGVFIFCWCEHCGNGAKLKTRFSEYFCSSSPLCQLAPALWLAAFHPIHTNAKILKWLKSFQCLKCDCENSMNAVKEVEFKGESPNLFERFTFSMEFKCGRVND